MGFTVGDYVQVRGSAEHRGDICKLIRDKHGDTTGWVMVKRTKTSSATDRNHLPILDEFDFFEAREDHLIRLLRKEQIGNL